jgi:hypothetical protein
MKPLKLSPLIPVALHGWAAAFLLLMAGFARAQTPVPTFLPTAGPTPLPTAVLREYTVQQDDNLWDIAGDLYNAPWLWPEFLKFNTIDDPNLIFPGQVLLVPAPKVLEQIKEKSPAEVKTIRENLEKLGAPVPITTLTAPPAAQPVSQAVLVSPSVPSPSPSPSPPATPSVVPTPEKTPTFKITGSKSINFSYSEAVGNSGTGFTNTGLDRHETLRLHMEGQLNDEVKITGDFAQSDLALDDDYDLTLTTKHWEAFFGDFSASLPGSQFLTTSLTTTGIRVTGKYSDWSITALFGTPRGRTVYEKFFGNDTQGPYTIPDVPMVPSSEIIWVNKQKLTRGVDYTIDYTLGNLTFINRIIQLTDLIEVQAQSSSELFSTQVYGYRVAWSPTGNLGSTVPAAPTPPASSTGLIPSGSQPVSAFGSGLPAATATPSVATVPTPGAKPPGGFQWVIGQGYMRQLEQPDADVTTATGRAAADTHIMELDTVLNWGPSLKISGETDGSLYLSSDNALAPSKEGTSYHLEGESFQGPFYLMGKISGTSPNFVNIGNPLVSGDFLEWSLLGNLKQGGIFAQADRTFQRTFTTGSEDDTTTDHGEAKYKSKDFPETDYVYYQSSEENLNPLDPFTQDDLRNTLSLGFGIPWGLSLKTSAIQESQTGTNLGVNNSYGVRAEVASMKWKNFNFSASGEWKLTNIVEAGSNTLVPQATPGNNIPSQTYTYTMEGKPLAHLTLTGKGSYTDAPPGPSQANLTESYQTDPFKWLVSNGSYSLDFQQTQILGNEAPDQVHTGSGNVDFTPLSWLKLSAQPSFRLDLPAGYGGKALSQNFHQNYRAALTPSIASFNGDYTLDQFWTWDGSTPGFPLNFEQQTETINLSAKKNLGKFSLVVSYKRSDQDQQNISASSATSSRTINQNENDSLSWNASQLLTFTLSHSYNQLNQEAPGQGNLDNPLLPNGTDSFNSAYPVNPQNASTYSHTFTGRVSEQITKALSIYEEGGYTHTVDVLQGGTVETYSPAAGFTWKLASALNWTTGYQYNGSSGEVDTTIQKAQTTLSASLNTASTLALNWNWTQASDPFLVNQQGTVSYTMNF